MESLASVGSVGAVMSQANIQVAYQVRMLKEQLSVAEDLAGAALKLIQSAIVDRAVPRHDLDLRA